MSSAPEIDVTSWTSIQVEARGSGLNLWLDDPDGQRWLYKATHIPKHSSEPQGEDWAEKVAEKLAALIGLPCNEVELAYRWTGSGRENGVISRDLAGGSVALQNGALLLADIPGYVYRSGTTGGCDLRPTTGVTPSTTSSAGNERCPWAHRSGGTSRGWTP